MLRLIILIIIVIIGIYYFTKSSSTSSVVAPVVAEPVVAEPVVAPVVPTPAPVVVAPVVPTPAPVVVAPVVPTTYSVLVSAIVDDKLARVEVYQNGDFSKTPRVVFADTNQGWDTLRQFRIDGLSVGDKIQFVAINTGGPGGIIVVIQDIDASGKLTGKSVKSGVHFWTESDKVLANNDMATASGYQNNKDLFNGAKSVWNAGRMSLINVEEKFIF